MRYNLLGCASSLGERYCRLLHRAGFAPPVKAELIGEVDMGIALELARIPIGVKANMRYLTVNKDGPNVCLCSFPGDVANICSQVSIGLQTGSTL